MKVILYTTHCPKCSVLEKKLNLANVTFETVEDVDVMTEKGFMSAPMLEVDGEVMDFSKAIQWLNEVPQNEDSCESCKIN